METQPARTSPALVIFLVVAVLLLVFSIISGFSIGLFIMPIPLVMFGSTAVWGRPWLVAGLVAGVVAGCMAYLLTVPLYRFERSSVTSGRPAERLHSSGCSGFTLPDTPLQDCDDARTRAFVIAGISTLVAGVGVGSMVRSFARRS